MNLKLVASLLRGVVARDFPAAWTSVLNNLRNPTQQIT